MDTKQFITPDAIVVYPSRLRQLWLICGSMLFVVTSIFLWKTGDLTRQIDTVAGAGLGGLGLLLGVMKLVKRRPALIINGAGILVNNSARGGSFLKWDEIESIYVSSGEVSSQAPPFSREGFMRIHLKDGHVSSIPTDTLPGSIDDLMTTIRQKRPAIMTFLER